MQIEKFVQKKPALSDFYLDAQLFLKHPSWFCGKVGNPLPL